MTGRQYDSGVKYAEQVAGDKRKKSQNGRSRHVQFCCATMSHDENLIFFFSAPERPERASLELVGHISSGV